MRRLRSQRTLRRPRACRSRRPDSAAGAQHPTFSYDLAGNGDLVLTDVVTRREGLLFPPEAPAGTYFLVDGKGFVAAEIVKVAGAARRSRRTSRSF